MDAAQTKDLMRDAYDRIFNRGDLDALDELVTDDFVDHSLPPELGDGDDRELVKEWFRAFRAAFPDLRCTVRDVLVDDDRCTGFLTLTGTQTGDFLGLAATGRRVEIDNIDIVRFEDGRIAEHWGVSTDLQAYAQLGVLPALPGQMSSVHRAAHGAFNARDWDAIRGYVTSGTRFVDHARALEMKTPEAFVDWGKEWVASSSDGMVEDTRYTESGGMSICRFRGRGTQDGPLGPFPASGNRFDLAFCEILHFDEAGRVTGQEIFYDQMNLLVQLGHVPPPQG